MKREQRQILVIEVNGSCDVIPKGNCTAWRIFKKLCKSKGFTVKGKPWKKCEFESDSLYICVEEKTAHIPKR